MQQLCRGLSIKRQGQSETASPWTIAGLFPWVGKLGYWGWKSLSGVQGKSFCRHVLKINAQILRIQRLSTKFHQLLMHKKLYKISRLGQVPPCPCPRAFMPIPLPRRNWRKIPYFAMSKCTLFTHLLSGVLCFRSIVNKVCMVVEQPLYSTVEVFSFCSFMTQKWMSSKIYFPCSLANLR